MSQCILDDPSRLMFGDKRNEFSLFGFSFFWVLTSAWSAQITTDLSDKIILPILAEEVLLNLTSAK